MMMVPNLCGITRLSLVVLASSLLVALILYGSSHWKEEASEGTYNCTTENETSICVLTKVCLHRPSRSDNSGYEFHLHTSLPLPIRPVAYLIAPDIFPQSGVYLKNSVDNPHFKYMEEDAYLFTRFHPDNLMHAIHDDILPTYTALASIYGTLEYPYNTRIFFADDFEDTPYTEILQQLTRFPLTSVSLGKANCFQRLIVGFDKTSLWYQYGFQQMQGPLPHNRTHIQTHIRKLFSVPPNTAPLNSQIVLFSRQRTRLILNEVELSLALARFFKLRVVVLDLETHSLSEITQEIAKAKLVVGMHGALLSSMVWLRDDAMVLELFPYAIPPTHYTPYKTLAGILQLEYLAWRNTHLENTVGHVDYPREYGGLMHLSTSEQRSIVNQVDVPPHYCCEDSSWLYHIYQDTTVSIQEILDLLKENLN